MEPKILVSKEKKLVGMHMTMSYAEFNVGTLWKNFMPRKNEIPCQLTNDLISLAIYPPVHFEQFNPDNTFEKWAAVEVSDFENIPDDMETFILPGGLYAQFHYRGLHTDQSFFRFIFESWLPGSSYSLDARPHFEILGEKYKNNDPASEEEIWIPVKPMDSGK